MPANTTPKQFLLFPDPNFSGDQLVSITSEEGRFVGQPVPDIGNEGDLLPFQSGTPTGDNNLRYRILRAGGLYSASWGWKDEEGGGNLFGVSDVRFWDNPHNPFQDNFEGYGTEVAYSKVFNRLLIYRRDAPGGSSPTVKIRFRDMDVDNDPDKYSSATFSPTNWPSANERSNIGVIELPDGVMRAFVQIQQDSTTSDFDVYESSDGGLTYTRIHQNVLQQFGLARNTYSKMRARISNDFIRVAFVDLDTSSKVRTFISSDRGSTWKGATILSDALFDNTFDYDNFSYDLVGLEDGAASFLMVTKTGANTHKFFLGTGEQDWQELTDFGDNFLVAAGASIVIDRVFLVRDNVRVYAFAYVRNTSLPAESAWVMRSCRLDRFQDTAEWSAIMDVDNGWPAFNGTDRFRMANIKAVHAADRIVVVHANTDNLTDSTGEIEAQMGAFDFMGWTQLSAVRARGNLGIPQVSQRLNTHEWIAAFGRPAGSGAQVSSLTEWTQTTSGAGTLSRDASGLVIHSDPSAENNYQVSEGGSPTDKWAEGANFIWTVQVENSPDVTASRAHARFRAFGSAGVTVGVAVRYEASAGTTQFVVVDSVGSIVLATVSGLTFDSEPFNFRGLLGQTAGVQKFQLQYKALAAVTWNSTGQLTLLQNGAFSVQSARFGHGVMPGGAGATSTWRDFRVSASENTPRGFTGTSDLKGRPAAPMKAYVFKGLSVVWGGGGGFEGDIFDEEKQYSLGGVNIFTPSPSLRWQSTSGVTQQLVFNAGQSQVYCHSGIGFFNSQTQQIVVEYADDLNFSLLVATETVSFDAIASAATTFTTLKGNTGIFSGAATTAFTSGELFKYFFKETSGSPAKAFEVTKHTGDLVQADGSSNTLAGAGLTDIGNQDHNIVSPDAVHIYSGRHVAQFMRWSFETPAARMTGPNISSAYAVGAVVVGTTLPIRVPMDWVHDDSEESHVNIAATPGGLRWSFKEGEPRRVIEGRIIGDVNEHRHEIRNMLRQLSDYGDNPMVLILNDQELTRREQIMYCRYEGPSALEQQGWYLDETSQIQRRLGDQGLRFSEEI